MPDVVLLSACRTAIGTAFKGTLRDTSALCAGGGMSAALVLSVKRDLRVQSKTRHWERGRK